MRLLATLAVTTFAATGMTLASPASASIVVASNQPGTASQGNGIHNTNFEAQTFTPTVGGTLSTVQFAFLGAGDSDLTLELRSTNASALPTTEVLATTTLAGSEVLPSGFGPLTYTTFSFADSAAELAEGTLYALVLTSTATDSDYDFSVLAGRNDYAGGELLGSSDGGTTFLPYGGTRPSVLDAAFVVTVPEPALGLAGSALLGLGLLRRRGSV